MSAHVHDGVYGYFDPACLDCQKEVAAEREQSRRLYAEVELKRAYSADAGVKR